MEFKVNEIQSLQPAPSQSLSLSLKGSRRSKEQGREYIRGEEQQESGKYIGKSANRL